MPPGSRFLARTLRCALAASVVLPVGVGSASADCVKTSATTICNTDTPNPFTTRVGAGNDIAGDGQTVTVESGASIEVVDDNAISLRDNAAITVKSGGLVQADSDPPTQGGYGTGGNTIEFRNNGTLTIEVGGAVRAIGTQGSAEAVNLQGTGNLITNRGTISAVNANAIWFQNTSGLNTVVNEVTGTIQAPVNVVGGSGNGAADFTNRGEVIGNLQFAGGNDILRIYTGSNITGSVSGGGGTDDIYLSGTGTDSISGSFTAFENLIKNETGRWTLTSAITGVSTVTVAGGTLALQGNNIGFAGTTTVNAGGVLEGAVQSIPLAVTNNGLVRFAEPGTGTYAGLISGTGGLEKTEAGTLIINNDQTYSGTTRVVDGLMVVGASGFSAATLSGGGNVTVEAGATLGGYGRVAGAVTNLGTIAVANAVPGFSGDGNGDFRLDSGLVNSGTVQIGGEGVGNTLTVGGNYVGSGGRIVLNTVLGSDDSLSDRLVIDGGSATGTTRVVINNVGGAGADTLANGILIVDAINGGSTAQGAFELDAPVLVGPYEYFLYRGATDGTAADDWFLRTDQEEPVYRDETSLYAALAGPALAYGRAVIGTLHERMGDVWAAGPAPADATSRGWARVIGQHGDEDGDPDGTGNNPAYTYTFTAFQGGIDVYRADTGETRSNAGVYGAIGGSRSPVSGPDGRAGDNTFQAYSLGGYWTTFGSPGWYVDAIGQLTWYDTQSDSVNDVDFDSNGFAFAGSLEMGYPVALEQGFTIEPQVQLVGQSLNLDGGSDGFSDISFDDTASLAGRAGVRLAKTWANPEAPALPLTAWLRGDVWHEFLDAPEVTFASDVGDATFVSGPDDTWFGARLGLSGLATANLQLQASAGTQISADGSGIGYDGTIGFVLNW